ncbi:MAG: SDR family NAD(P)-dependent oxidoreductase [Tannerellaceae bacterium]|nr:SDR family NAD(P)-dependent oxidoreductase [Tannerellaceae bacterium]
MKWIDKLLFPTAGVSGRRLAKAVQGKTIVITGASYGIGECVARRLAGAGVTLILTARTEDKLCRLKKELEDKGCNVSVFPCDLYDLSQTELLVEQIKEVSPQVDILINNAGKSIFRPVACSVNRFHDFTRTMSINYYSPVRLTIGLYESLKKQKGQMIYVSALNVLFSSAPGWAAYQASKTAMDSWGKAVAFEWKKQSICITSIYLPLVRTRMIEPNSMYKNSPAMTPQQAATIVCRMILKRSRQWSPWWSIFPRYVSVLFPRVWGKLAASQPNKKDEVCGNF